MQREKTQPDKGQQGNGQQKKTPPGKPGKKAAVTPADRLDQIAAHCARQGIRLTDLRRDVLSLLLEAERALGAYELLDALRRTHANAQPPTIYRALDFLRETGLAHRIDSLNAFVACRLDAHDHSLLLVCPHCGKVSEVNDSEVFHLVARHARSAGFRLPNECLEIKAACEGCAEPVACCEGHECPAA